MALKTVFLLLVGTLLANVAASGVLPALPPGLAYTRAIPYNVPPFAAAVSFLRTGPVIAPAAALLPPHLHARYSPVAVAPHFHSAVPAPIYPQLHPHLHAHAHLAPAPLGFAGVPAVLPHGASPVPHVGLLPAPHAHLAPVPAPIGVPHVHPYAAALPGFAPAPHLHAHAYAAPAHAHAPAIVPQVPHVQALPHAHGHAAFAPLVARGLHHGHFDALHHHK